MLSGQEGTVSPKRGPSAGVPASVTRREDMQPLHKELSSKLSGKDSLKLNVLQQKINSLSSGFGLHLPSVNAEKAMAWSGSLPSTSAWSGQGWAGSSKLQSRRDLPDRWSLEN